MQISEKIPKTRELGIKPCPPAGEGVHRWVYHVVCRMIECNFNDLEIVSLCEEYSTRLLQPNEVENAILSRRGSLQNPSIPKRPRWPQRSQVLVDQYLGSNTVEGLCGLSPMPVNEFDSETILKHLFPGNPLLCCGISSRIFATRSLAEWHGELAKCQLIVPSPMSARHGYTQSGKRSAHTLQNTGPRKYLVVEFDEGTHDDHASLLSYLNTNMTPLVCAVMSGNKSLHGWFRVEDWNDEKQISFFKRATSIGADPATWTRSQFVRMPNGTRNNGAKQTTLYLSK